MAIEFELKFRATPQKQKAIEAAITGNKQIYQMRTTYYDTVDGALSKRWYTLRKRMENEISVCTLKSPAGAIGREETEVECEDIHQAIPMLCKLSGIADLVQLTCSGVVEVCGAAFTRTAITVELEDAVLEIALDLGVLMGAGKEVPLCEVEVELKSGNQTVAQAYAAVLARRYDLVPEKYSKFKRALALCKGE